MFNTYPFKPYPGAREESGRMSASTGAKKKYLQLETAILAKAARA
jgi:hypothetical protein